MAITIISEGALSAVSVHKLPDVVEGQADVVKHAMYDPVRLLAEGVNKAIGETQAIFTSLDEAVKAADTAAKAADTAAKAAQSTADKKYDKSGGTITGEVTIDNKLTVNGNMKINKGAILEVDNINVYDSIVGLRNTKCTTANYRISVSGAAADRIITISDVGVSYIAHYTGGISGVVYIDKIINNSWVEQFKCIYPILLTVVKHEQFLAVIGETGAATQKYSGANADTVGLYRLRIAKNSYGALWVTRHQ